MLFSRWKDGDETALSQIASIAYPDLRSLAGYYLTRERSGHTLQATGLVNELYLRLRQMQGVDVTNREHFYSLAARVMRRILVDYARNLAAQKRPSAKARVPLHDEVAWVDALSDDMIDLDEALDALAVIDARKLRAVEYRYILGCSQAETAQLLGVSSKTVGRDLEFAKTWLYRRLRSTPADPAKHPED